MVCIPFHFQTLLVIKNLPLISACILPLIHFCLVRLQAEYMQSYGIRVYGVYGIPDRLELCGCMWITCRPVAKQSRP